MSMPDSIVKIAVFRSLFPATPCQLAWQATPEVYLCNKVDRLQEHSTTSLLPLFYYRAKLDNEQYHWQDTLKNDFKKRLLQNMWPWLK